MPIEIVCPGCERTLRVPDDHAGKPARCPECNQVTTIPLPDAPTESDTVVAEAVAVDDSQWHMRTPEGASYGPVSQPELDDWVREGRVTFDCDVRRDEDEHPWVPAGDVYPELLPSADQPASQPSAAPAPTARPMYTAGHRGGLILAFGILTWFTCPALGVMAWILGNADLREIREGRMDPAGLGFTQAGRTLGMVHFILFVIASVVGLFSFLIVAGFN